MRTISKYNKNRIYLDDPLINSDDFQVKYTIIDDLGNVVHDAEDKPIQNKDAEKEGSDKIKYYAEWKFKEVNGKYFRLVFTIYDKDENFVVSDFALVEMGVEANRGGEQLVPIDYFKEYILSSNLTDEMKQKLLTYPKDGLEEFLLAARAELEDDLEISFTLSLIESETHDWFGDWINDTFWQMQVHHFPIFSVQNYSLWYGNQKIMDIEPKYLQVNKVMGMMEWMPVVGQPLFELYQHSLEAMAMTLSMRTGTGRLPDVFHVSYTHGLDWANLEEKERSAIRVNVGRKAMLTALGRISPDVIKGNESQSIDGVSYSAGNRGLEWLRFERSELDKWIDKSKRKFNTHLKHFAV